MDFSSGPKVADFVQMCGKTWITLIKAEVGHPASFLYKCNDYRGCVLCRAEKVDFEFGNLAQAHDLHRAEIALDDVGAFVKRLSRAGISYRAFPQGETKAFFLDFGIDGAEATMASKEELDRILQAVPRETRISGKMICKKEEQVEDMEGTVMIEEELFVVEGLNRQEQHLAWECAMGETQHLNPADGESLQEALDERQRAFYKFVQKMDGKVTILHRRRRNVRLSAINWSLSDKWTSEGHEMLFNKEPLPLRSAVAVK